MFKLKYVPGAVPGKAIKRKISEEEVRNCQTTYEAKRKDRQLNTSWQKDRPWLVFENDQMKCAVCIEYMSDKSKHISNTNLKNQNTFIAGCTNRRVSAVIDHEKSKTHISAVEIKTAKSRTSKEIRHTEAGKASMWLQKSAIDKLAYLFRNTHAVVKNDRPLSDYDWLCLLDQAKCIDIGSTYLNRKAALMFTTSIAESERKRTVSMLGKSFFSFLMDGSTDISGDEQEAIYIRFTQRGEIIERFLGIGTPTSTCSKDLEEFVVKMLESNEIDKAQLVAMGSDGASNMVGIRSGLSTLLREHVNKEMINVHCFAHRLELAFRDVLKKNKHYNKLMTLLIGLHYFYKKQYKNKQGLLNTMAVMKVNGLLPPKVTGTRWMAHLWRGIQTLVRTFTAYNAHLSTISHQNAKAEGLVKIMLGKDLVCFLLFLQNVLDPLMRLSLKLQKPQCNVAECIVWIEATCDLLHNCKERSSDELEQVISQGSYQDIALRGNTPTMSYKETIIDGIIEAMKNRFDLTPSEISVISCTKLLHLQKWPNSNNMKEFGVNEVKTVAQHFHSTISSVIPNFDVDDVVSEWNMIRHILYKKHGDNLQSMTWKDLYDDEFPI